MLYGISILIVQGFGPYNSLKSPFSSSTWLDVFFPHLRKLYFKPLINSELGSDYSSLLNTQLIHSLGDERDWVFCCFLVLGGVCVRERQRQRQNAHYFW